MPDFWFDVDTALTGVPVNLLPLIDDTDFKSRETAVPYNAAGMDLVWNFVTPGGSFSQTPVTPTTGGNYDWAHEGDGMYTITMPASGGASINNDVEGFGWFTGLVTGVLPWRGPTIGFRAAGLNNLLVENAFSATRGLAGTALPDAAAEAAGGLYTRGTGAGQINQAANGQMDANAVALSGDSAAADNAEAFFDGTGYAGTGNTIPTVTTVTNQVTANVTGISGDATAADNLEAALDGTGGVTISAGLTGNITGNLSGSVGSVTGAVGSVTGAVGSVTGAVGSVTGAVGSVTGNVVGSVGSVTGNVGGNVVGSVGSVTTVSDKTGYRLSSTGVDDLADEVFEGSFTLRQLVRLMAAALLGELSGAATTTITIRDASDTKTRITATVDSDGNRSALTLDAT